MLGDRLEPGHDVVGCGRVLPAQGPPLEHPLDALGHVPPGPAQRGVQGHDPMIAQPENQLGRLMAGQIVQHQQCSQRWRPISQL